MKLPALTPMIDTARQHLAASACPHAERAVRALHEYARKGGHTREITKELGRVAEYARCLPQRSEERAALQSLANTIQSAIGATA